MSKEAVFQEMSMNYKNLQTIVNNLEKNKEDQAVKMARILRQQTECLSENERFKRELLTQEKLLQQVEQQYKKRVQDLQHELEMAEVRAEEKRAMVCMAFEDLRTRTALLVDVIAELEHALANMTQRMEDEKAQKILFMSKFEES